MGIYALINTVLILSSAVVVLSEMVTKYTKVSGSLAQLQSWVIAVLMGVVCSWLNFGIFNGTDTKGGMVYGIIIGLIANGIFDISIVQAFLSKIGLKKN